MENFCSHQLKHMVKQCKNYDIFVRVIVLQKKKKTHTPKRFSSNSMLKKKVWRKHTSSIYPILTKRDVDIYMSNDFLLVCVCECVCVYALRLNIWHTAVFCFRYTFTELNNFFELDIKWNTRSIDKNDEKDEHKLRWI